jgi:peptidoglycan/LPS O-acetylase OafA/YrhL
MIFAQLPTIYIRKWPGHYKLLGGLRGLACLGVLLFHLGVVPYGHYCVMVFFVISGYCITASALSSLRRGVSFAAYMSRRIRRIFPPYLIAVAFFAITRFLRPVLTNGPPWRPSWLDWLQNLTLTQWMSIPFHPVGWPDRNPKLFVVAFWSLNYEEQFYLVTGLLLMLALRYRIGLARGVLTLAALGLAWDFMVPGGKVYGLFIEYWAHFALGGCLYFVLCEYPRPRIWSAFLLAAVLLGTYCVVHIWVFWSGGGAAADPLRSYLELAVLSVVSIGLLLARPLSEIISNSLAWRPIAAVGTISYSLYLVHLFNLHLVATVAKRIVPTAAPGAFLIATEVLLHLSIGAAFWYLCERPFLNRRQSARAPIPTANSLVPVIVKEQA